MNNFVSTPSFLNYIFSYTMLRSGAASGAIALAIFALLSAALAQNVCSAAPVGGGAVNLTADNVTITGADSTAITATSDAGNVNITSTGSVVASGLNGGGIFASSITGDASVIANNVSTLAALTADIDGSRAAISATGANAAVRVNGRTQFVARFGRCLVCAYARPSRQRVG